jgi:hypothetical protein
MREFHDTHGNRWMARVEGREGADYQGRYHLVMEPLDEPGDPVSLDDVRWNSVEYARYTLESSSEVELRRRLRSALGRSLR